MIQDAVGVGAEVQAGAKFGEGRVLCEFVVRSFEVKKVDVFGEVPQRCPLIQPLLQVNGSSIYLFQA